MLSLGELVDLARVNQSWLRWCGLQRGWQGYGANLATTATGSVYVLRHSTWGGQPSQPFATECFQLRWGGDLRSLHTRKPLVHWSGEDLDRGPVELSDKDKDPLVLTV